MTEHKLSEKELQQIREEAEKYIPLGDPMSEYPSYYHEIEIERAYEAGAIAALTRERERVKGLVEKGELLAEGAQHLFDMKKQKGSTSVMKNAWNILAIRLYDLKEALNKYKTNDPNPGKIVCRECHDQEEEDNDEFEYYS